MKSNSKFTVYWKTVACILGKDTGEVRFVKLNNLRSEFIKLFNKYGQQQTVLEASSYSYQVFGLIEDLVSEIQTANPSKVKVIAESPVKTDKIDAQTLAQLLAANYIPQTYVRSRDNRRVIGQLRQRMFWFVRGPG